MDKILKNAFVKTELIKKTISIIDQKTGETHKAAVFVKPLSFSSAVEDLKNYGGDETEQIARRIASSICDEKGESIFTAEQITGEGGQSLSPALTKELLFVIGEVNFLGK